jgi:hypothetical protein
MTLHNGRRNYSIFLWEQSISNEKGNVIHINKDNSCKEASPCLKIMFGSFIKSVKETNILLEFAQTITCKSLVHNVFCNLQYIAQLKMT